MVNVKYMHHANIDHNYAETWATELLLLTSAH
jgi:hypothetical protein